MGFIFGQEGPGHKRPRRKRDRAIPGPGLRYNSHTMISKPRSIPGQFLLPLLVALACFLPGSRAAAQSGTAAFDEYLVKGSLLINISKFVKWPAVALPETPRIFTIGVLGMNPFADRLDELARAGQIQGRRVRVVHFKGLEEVEGCQLVFVSVSETRRLDSILPALHARHILTVSDIRGFMDRGGMVGLIVANNRVQFEINEAAARSGGLKFSSQVLRLAHRVVQ